MNSGLEPVQRAAAELGLIFCGASTGYLSSELDCLFRRTNEAFDTIS